MFLCIYGPEMKRFPCSFLTNTLPTLNVPLHSHSFSLLDPSCLPCCSAGWAVGLARVKRGSSSVVLTGWWKQKEGVVFCWRPLCYMSDQSSMDIGDPLGDRFWLSPKKGKWETQIDHNVIQEQEAWCSEWMAANIGGTNAYVMKRCGQVQTFLHISESGELSGENGKFMDPCSAISSHF